ncbi:immunoglobulin superfamily member 6 [Eleginops maclovinus]|uniref:immunoglobulin superfamily member 6 n=1 Tax=Eleginops maclovinus TaxID=56733 RepID=UPI0030800D38
MDRLFCFSLLLTYLPVTESMEDCLTQPNNMIWQKTGQSVFLKCTLHSHCLRKEFQFGWFAFKENFHLRLNLSKNFQKYSLDNASLNIKSLHTNDSGIYYCAVWSNAKAAGAQYIALGTTLVVSEYVNPMVRHVLLWLSFVLLAIYSLALVILILKKCGYKISDCKRMGKTDKPSEERNSTKRAHFRDVLQEMYSKRNLDRGVKAENKKRSKAKAPSTEFNGSTDDIYQNV